MLLDLGLSREGHAPSWLKQKSEVGPWIEPRRSGTITCWKEMWNHNLDLIRTRGLRIYTGDATLSPFSKYQKVKLLKSKVRRFNFEFFLTHELKSKMWIWLNLFAHEQKIKVWIRLWVLSHTNRKVRCEYTTLRPFSNTSWKVKCGYDFESFRTRHKSKEWPRPCFCRRSSAKKTNMTFLLQGINIPKNTCDFASVGSWKVNYLEIRLWDPSPDVLKNKLKIRLWVFSSNRDTTLSHFSIK